MPKKKTAQKKKALWSGRFSTGVDAAVQKFSRSVQFDWRLYRQDIRGSIAHARMLRKIGVLTAGELRSIESGLKQIGKQIDAGKFKWDESLEDVHMNIESALTKLTPAGAKLHTARSRNDQVATDMRLWVKEQIGLMAGNVELLQKTLVVMGSKNMDVCIPGYTHLQRAQPVYLAHHLLAYVEMLERDKGRLADCYKRADVMPLGSGALAGTTIKLDRKFTANELDFAAISQNSLDAVSDRDFMVELAFACSMIMVHLSRLAEDLILWSSSEFDYIRIGDAYTTGSSLMPQKKNPDVAELVRGKSARVIGDVQSLLVLLKGLPMTYNRDLQEDKEQLFDAVDHTSDALVLTAEMLDQTQVKADKCAAAVADPLLFATDIADYFVNKGVAFRHAHEVVGKAVALAEQRKIGLDELTVKDWQELNPVADARIKGCFKLKTAMAKRSITGAPGTKPVRQQLLRWMDSLE
ncbi:MAG: argininosuccinate lyase [Verrucomicrobiota bacterium]